MGSCQEADILQKIPKDISEKWRKHSTLEDTVAQVTRINLNKSNTR